MSDDSNWLKNPTLPRPPAVPYFEPEELDGVSESDRRFIARGYAREGRGQQSQRISGVARSSADSVTPPLRRTA
ncbi:MAG TPA: hypothetical protein VHW01_02800 [Polyangiaceae bacterium]|nr:hypothetical protein [Polyangiaceae bacterium]